MDSNEFLSLDGNPLLGSALPDDPLLKGISSQVEDRGLFGTQKSRKDSAYTEPLNEELKPLWVEEAEENERTTENPKISPLPTLRNFPYSYGNYSDSISLNIDPLTGTTKTSPLASSEVNVPQTRSHFSWGGESASLPLFEAPKNLSSTSNTTLSPSVPLTWAIKAEGTVTVNSGGDFDGDPIDLTDDALIYAGAGFTFNGKVVLPVQHSATGKPIVDASGQPLLVDQAVTVAAGYQVANVSNNNRYSGLLPPQIVPKQTVDVPAYPTLKTQELNRLIPPGTTEVIFKANSKPLNNASDWNNNFPTPGTASKPKVVKVTGGGLHIPPSVDLNHYVLLVESGDINVNVTNLNEAPILLTLSYNSVAEQAVAVTVIGQLRTTDPDIGDTHTYELTDNASGRFQLVGDLIQVAPDALLDFETNNSFTITVHSTDGMGLSKIGQFTINLTNINEVPTNLTLNPNTLTENIPNNSIIGNFITNDPDAGDNHTYTLVTGDGDTDNAAFSIVGNQLQLKNSPDFEAKNRYDIRVRTTDAGGLNVEKILTVSITNVNEAPTYITLSNNAVDENAAANTVIGQLNTTDPDTGDNHTYTLIDDAQGRFSLVENRLQVAPEAILDFENNNSFTITIRSTDAAGGSKTQQFVIGLKDINEAPTSIAPNPNSLVENTPNHSVVGSITTTDPDAGDSHTYTSSIQL